MAGIHSRYSPSGLYLTMACAGSLKLREAIPPEPDSPESIEGTVAHHVASQLALGVVVPEGSKYLNVEIDEDMIAGAQLWVDTVGNNGAFEMPVACPDVHPDCWGTPDYWLYDGSTLYVCDYKYGHRYVNEFENVQLSAYASGVIRALNLPSDTQVILGVVQPRCYMDKQVRTWVTTTARVVEIAGKAGDAVREAINGGPCTTGPHCIDCSARGRCNTLRYAANQSLQFIQAAELHDQTSEALGVEMTLLDAAAELVKARRGGIAAMAEAMIRSGQRVPGWELKPGRSNLVWNDPAQVLEIDADLAKPAQPITPTQALSKKLVDQAFIDRLASRPPAALKLAPVSTKATRKIFSGA